MTALGLAAAACTGEGPGPSAAASGGPPPSNAAAPAPGGEAPDSKLVVGPAGFTIDLADCPAKWSDTAGLTDTEVRIGQSYVLSGPLAPFGAVVSGMTAAFNYVNATEGGIGGRRVTLITKDDRYEAARAKDNVEELLAAGNVFAFSANGSTSNNLATYDRINDSCVPDLLVGSGHPAWGDPLNRPWVSGSILAYPTEAALWGRHILDALGPGATVAMLQMNNDFGASMRTSFEAQAAAHGLSLVRTAGHDPAAPSVSNELTTLASTNADVFLAATSSTYCSQALSAIEQSTWRPKLTFLSQTCGAVQTYLKPAGRAANGVIVAAGAKDLADRAYAEDPTVKLVREQLAAANLDPGNSQHGNGWWNALGAVEILRNASRLPGGLTRTNVMLATRSMDWQNPLFIDGVRFVQNGNKDSFTVEAAQLQQYRMGEGQTVGAYERIGRVIDLNGATKNCAWDGKACREY
ncbi:MAG: ABC transporter substrate-binding protein [Acidimicrobiales bacterium]